MKLITIELAFMILSKNNYPMLHSDIYFCLEICFQRVLNFGMSMGQRYRYQQNPLVLATVLVRISKHIFVSVKVFILVTKGVTVGIFGDVWILTKMCFPERA